MPVVVDPDPMVVESLLATMPAGSHGVESVDRLTAWLSTHSDEYVVVLGPTLTDEEVDRHLRGAAHQRAHDQHHPGPRAARR